MSLTGISSLQSARRKFFMISSQNMCNHLESHVFGLFHELTAEHV